ncbi:MAG: HEPN domain-containing protein [Acidobacteriota bacterium]|nr:HEPN domain-containing protein [Acidobacteriota bacterium]
MKPITAEWVEKAEEDWVSLLRSYRARKNPSYNVACFHAQQCAEKYLKARLVEAGVVFPKTHDLSLLLTLVQPIEPGWGILQPELDTLNKYAIAYRYPGQSATKADAKEAVDDCRTIRQMIRISLGLPV